MSILFRLTKGYSTPVFFFGQCNKNMQKKRIILTGGGTLGHVMPNMVLIDELQKDGWAITYIGSYTGPERKALKDFDIEYIPISTGKLRRHSGKIRNKLGPIGRFVSWRNFKDLFNIAFGIFKSIWVVARRHPQITFSKGGFVAFPAVLARWLNRVPVVIHESDMTPGLTTKLSKRFAKKICTAFENTQKYLPKHKVVHTGLPVRKLVFEASAEQGKAFANFENDKPILLVFGGSLGAQFLNNLVRKNLEKKPFCDFNIINICGAGNLDGKYAETPNYRQYETLQDEFLHVMAAADFVISRGGATSLFELLAMKKLHLIIPLSRKSSRGDQIDNAQYFKELGVSDYLEEADYSWGILTQKIEAMLDARTSIIDKINIINFSNSSEKVLAVICNSKK